VSLTANHLSKCLAPLTVVLCLCVTWLTASLASAQFGEIIAFESPGNTTYHLDAESGSDENAGTRKESAWKTLRRVNTTRFAPGDRLLIKAGTTYHGRLWPKGSGTRGNPIIIDRFGDGPRPAIHAEGESSEALLLDNQRSWHIKNLELTNTGDGPEMFRYGVNIIAEDFANAGDIKLVNLFIHDVNGSTKPGLGRGAGITWRNQGTNIPTSFNGILIEHCTLKDIARDGIAGENSLTDRRGWTPNQNIVIRENVIENVQGDGIRLTGSDNAIIEYNQVIRAGLAQDGLAGGIHVTNSDGTLVQYNVVSQTQGKANAAMRSGTNSRDNTFQFNYSFDNAGPLAIIEAEPPSAQASPNVGTAVRYNIGQNDGGAFRIIGPVHGTRLHNNTVYTPPGSQTVSISLSDRSGPPTDTTLANNLFYVQGQATIVFDPAVEDSEVHYLSNAYFGPQPLPEAETDPLTANPRLVDPGTGQTTRDGLEGYQTLDGSPLRNAGTRIHKHGSHDFWANPVPGGKKVDIGAYQAPSDKPPASTQPDPAP
jgi:parallel beta helix pectate lyase-like protein